MGKTSVDFILVRTLIMFICNIVSYTNTMLKKGLKYKFSTHFCIVKYIYGKYLCRYV